MNVTIPPALAHMAPMLSEFFDAMVHKLHVNAHKDAIRPDDVDKLLELMQGEIQELRDQQVQDATDPNILHETVDMANFPFLIYAHLRSRGVQTLREQFINEYMDIDVHAGRIFCKKTRPGSPYKMGDEIEGVLRGGVRYIRAQHSITGASVSLPRRDIIWWGANGVWPERPLEYGSWSMSGAFMTAHSRPSIDRVENLQIRRPPVKLPFVSQWKPRGRENNLNYGKWRYQRRHRGALIVVGYWDTEEQAAREGIKAWKLKTRG